MNKRIVEELRGISEGLKAMGVDKLVQKTTAEAANALEKALWIPVEERLPDGNDHFLVCFEDGFVTGVSYFEDDWELWANSGDVIAWMPMPEPYKK